jgi:amidase
MTGFAFRSAVALAAAVRERRISSRALLEMYLERVASLNPKLNAVVALQVDKARARADAADAALARGDAVGPLHGVPATVKEAFDVEGLPTTWGSPAHKANIATSTAVSVERLERAGAVVFGKTNVPLFLADWQSFNDVYGTSSNPWNAGRTPGGSSGGSAAALAAGLAGFEWGSDIGGSLRVPAHFCGIYTHKPTWGIVPPDGHGLAPAPATDISVVGPMARSAKDLRVLLEVTAGPHGPAARGWRLALPACEKRTLREFRVAVMLDTPQAEVDGGVRACLEAAVDFLRSQGATVDTRARPEIDLDQVARDSVHLIRGATSGKMPQEEFDRALRARAGHADADDSYEARHARGVAATHREWLIAHGRRYRMQLAWERFFTEWDLFLCPPASTTAFAHDHSLPRHERVVPVNGRPRPSIEQGFWAGLAGIAHLPASVLPVGTAPDGMPVGLQAIGPLYGDFGCITFAELMEAHYRAFEAPPALRTT